MGAGVSMVDYLNRNVRYLLRTVLGMPEGSVRPANQKVGRGAQTDERATVFIASSRDRGWAATSRLATASDGSTVTDGSEAVKEFVASVNFYGARPAAAAAQSPADPAGLAVMSGAAMSRAARLKHLLQLDASLDTMEALGVFFLNAGPALDLTAVVDGNYEARAHIDLTFTVVNQEVVVTPTIALGEFTLIYQSPGGRLTTKQIEVPT